MFDIGFPELIVITIVGLLVIGPDRLPEALRTLGLWVGRMRRSFTNVKNEIEKEIGMDEIRRQLHNEAVMEEMKRIERDVRHSVDTTADQSPGAESIAPASPGGTEPADPSGGTEAAPTEPSVSVDDPASAGARDDRSHAAPPETPTDDEPRRG